MIIGAIMADNHWSQQDAVTVCVMLEAIAPAYGAHVALTGGCLYKIGLRKDIDILFYRIRQVEHIDVSGLMAELIKRGIEITNDHGWVIKALVYGRKADFFFPERKPNPTLSHTKDGWYE